MSSFRLFDLRIFFCCSIAIASLNAHAGPVPQASGMPAAEAAPALLAEETVPGPVLVAGYTPPDTVCFYEHVNFGGRSFCAVSGQEAGALSPDWNDRISSVDVGEDVIVQVCQHNGFGGWCTELPESANFYGMQNDNISSFRVVSKWRGRRDRGGFDRYGRRGERRSMVCFYEHAEYRGAHFCASAGERSRLVPPGWNDRISSIRIIGRAEVAVCEHRDFGGWCTNYVRDIPYVGDARNDQISSYAVSR